MKAKMISKIILSAWILVFLFLFAGVNLNVAQAATYTVTNTDDSGAGSLRQAILDANANPGPDNIEFAIPAAGVQTINPINTALDPITDPVTIDGYTQCYSPNPCAAVATASLQAVILIEISGDILPGAAGRSGLTLNPGSSGSTIRGLSINRFKRAGAGSGHAINITGGGLNWIAGNYLNIAPDGVTVFTGDPSWGAGIIAAGSGGNIIGHDPLGPNSSNPAADRNIISGSGTGGFNGVDIQGQSSGNKIRGNYIGTDATGTADLGNSRRGIRLLTGSNTIENNLVSGNDAHGILSEGDPITAGGNVIRGNIVGTNVTGTAALTNGSDGIVVLTTNNTIEKNLASGNTLNNAGGIVSAGNPGPNLIKGNIVGTDMTGTIPLGNLAGGIVLNSSSNNEVVENVVAFNSFGGVLIVKVPVGGFVPVSNKILSNSIYGNSVAPNPGGADFAGLGIDLIPPLTSPNPADIITGPDVNDPLDADVGPNNFQNFPVIDVADSFLNPSHVQVRVRLDSKPNQDYLIQGFLSTLADPSGHGEGEVLVAEKIVTTDATGHVDFRLPVPLKLLPVRSIFTTTATDLITMDTSEFSKWENLDDVQDVRGSPTTYEQVGDAVGDDGLDDMPWSSWEERAAEEPTTEE